MAERLWVKLNSQNPTRVSTKKCQIVDEFIEKIKAKLSPDLDSVATSRILISKTDGGSALDPGLLLTQAPFPTKNDSKSPLFVCVLAVNCNLIY